MSYCFALFHIHGKFTSEIGGMRSPFDSPPPCNREVVLGGNAPRNSCWMFSLSLPGAFPLALARCKWFQMISNDINPFVVTSDNFIWCQMIQNHMTLFQMTNKPLANYCEWCPVLTNDFRWFQMVSISFSIFNVNCNWFQLFSFDLNRSQLISSDFERCQAISTDFKPLRKISHDFKLFELVPKYFKWSPVARKQLKQFQMRVSKSQPLPPTLLSNIGGLTDTRKVHK